MVNKHPAFHARSLADYSFLFDIETREALVETSQTDDPLFIKELEHFAAWFRVHHDIETKKTRTTDLRNELELMRGHIERLLGSLDLEDQLFFTALSNIDLDLLLELRIKLRGVSEGTESALRSIKTIRSQDRQILFSHRELAARIAAVLDTRGVEITRTGDGVLGKCLEAILKQTQRIELECGHLDYSIVAEPQSIIEAAWDQIKHTLEASGNESGAPSAQVQEQIFERELTAFKIKALFHEFHDALREDGEVLSPEELSERAMAHVAEVLQMSPNDILTALGETSQTSLK